MEHTKIKKTFAHRNKTNIFTFYYDSYSTYNNIFNVYKCY